MKKIAAFLHLFAITLQLVSCGPSRDGHVVTFVVNGNKTKVTVKDGETPVYPGDMSWETAEHYYKITGWDKEIVPATENAVYTATVGEYGLTAYDIRFNMPNGLVRVETHEGETPTPPAGYEKDLSRAEVVGTFSRWEPELVAPTAENMQGKQLAVYTPVYVYSTRYYVVTFVVRGVEHPVVVPYGTVPEGPTDLAAAQADNYAVRFSGWDKEIVAVSKDTTYTAVYGSAAVILPAKGGAKGVMTMTYDDGQLDTAKWVNRENKKYGLTGSCMLIAGRTALSDNLSEWKALFAETLEPESHSMNHDTLPAEGSGKYETHKIYNTQGKYKTELIDAKTRLQELFPGSDILCFAPASNTLSTYSFAAKSNGDADLTRPIADGGAEKVARDTYYAIRQGARGIQSLDPTYGTEAGGWYNLHMQGFSSFEGDAKLTAGKSWIDQAVQQGGWLIVMCHGIEGPNAKGTSPLEITEAAADAFFAYAGEYVERGELWSATFGDATKYVRERQNTTVFERYANGTVYVDMTISRTTADSKVLAEEIFNHPLTVEVRVPADWNTVSYRTAGGTATASVYSRDGARFAMVDLVPGADGATVTTAIDRLN
ncbi:MAG: hypothetical protein J6X72_00265 [Clostridia bacterium]|nr:hypothetical protein [Clostridia bacterium]